MSLTFTLFLLSVSLLLSYYSAIPLTPVLPFLPLLPINPHLCRTFPGRHGVVLKLKIHYMYPLELLATQEKGQHASLKGRKPMPFRMHFLLELRLFLLSQEALSEERGGEMDAAAPFGHAKYEWEMPILGFGSSSLLIECD